MARLTDDPNDSDLTHGVDEESVDQAKAYLVLSEAERKMGWKRPFRDRYTHVRGLACGVATRMGRELGETYARDPKFYGATYCVGCMMHLPVTEFDWDDGEVVGS